MMRIASDVLSRLKKLYDGKITEDNMLEKLVSDPTVRYKKDALKLMVKQFYAQNRNGQEQNKKIEKTEIQLEQLLEDKTKKKRKTQPDYRYESKECHNLKNLGGIESVVEDIRKYIFTPMVEKQPFKIINVKPSRGFMLVGSMGSGKTQIGFSILSEAKLTYGINAFYVTSSQLIKDSQDTIEKLFKMALQNKPSMIFIDDIHQLCSKENKKQSSALLLLGSQFDKTEDEEIYLLASTSAPDKVDLALRRSGRFDREITIDNPNEDGRTKIIEKLLQNVKTNMKGNEAKISASAAGFVAADLVGLVKEAAMQCVIRVTQNKTATDKIQTVDQLPKEIDVEATPDIQIIEEDFTKALAKVEPLCKKQGFTSIPDVSLDDVGALGALKDELIKSIIIPIKQRQKFKKMQIPLSAGLLLYGPPGCGKTMLAKAIANAAKANFITVKGPELLSKYVGQSEESVRKVFQRAKASAPCIIFFDEFDALAPKRQDQGNQVTERVVNTLLNQLNGVEERKMIFVIAATNRPDIIDQAILRSGRIEKHLLVPLPTVDDRVAILQAIVRKINIDPLIPLAEIAKNSLCEGFSGADLHHLVKQACILAIMAQREQLLQEDLLKSLQKIVVMKRRIA